MFKIILTLIFSILVMNYSWAYLTAGKVAVTATSSSSGVSSTSQDSDISDAVGTSVGVGVPVTVTGNVNISGVYQVNGTPISATSNWNQKGSTINYIAGNVGIGSTTPGQILDVHGTVRSSFFVGPINTPYMKFTNTQTSGTAGGTSVGGSWQTYPINTKDNDTAGIAVLTGSVITLPAGTYQVRGNANWSNSGTASQGQLRIFNNTDSSILIVGNNSPASLANNDTQSLIDGQFTIATSKNIILQYQVSNGISTDGLGNPFSFGSEVYATLEIWKTA